MAWITPTVILVQDMVVVSRASTEKATGLLENPFPRRPPGPLSLSLSHLSQIPEFVHNGHVRDMNMDLVVNAEVLREGLEHDSVRHLEHPSRITPAPDSQRRNTTDENQSREGEQTRQDQMKRKSKFETS